MHSYEYERCFVAIQIDVRIKMLNEKMEPCAIVPDGYAVAKKQQSQHKVMEHLQNTDDIFFYGPPVADFDGDVG